MVEEICCYNFISTELFKPLPKRKRDDIILFTCRKLCGRVSAVEQHSGVIVDSLHNRKQLVNLLLGKLNSLILKNTVNILRFTTKRDMFMQSRNQPICIDFSVVLLKPFPQLRIMRLAIGITVFQNLFCFVFADNVTGFALMHTLHRLVILSSGKILPMILPSLSKKSFAYHGSAFRIPCKQGARPSQAGQDRYR